jgi:mutator family transposase
VSAQTCSIEPPSSVFLGLAAGSWVYVGAARLAERSNGHYAKHPASPIGEAEERSRAEQALVTVVATAYLLGVSTRRVQRLAEQLGVKSLSRWQVIEMATHLDA